VRKSGQQNREELRTSASTATIGVRDARRTEDMSRTAGRDPSPRQGHGEAARTPLAILAPRHGRVVDFEFQRRRVSVPEIGLTGHALSDRHDRHCRYPAALLAGTTGPALVQERYNAIWLEERGVGIALDSFANIPKTLAYLSDPEPIDLYRARARALNNRALFEIADILERIPSDGAEQRLEPSSTRRASSVPLVSHPRQETRLEAEPNVGAGAPDSSRCGAKCGLRSRTYGDRQVVWW
jgi:hypothetical protein